MDVANLFNVSGKVVLVTGGGRGIGRMIAQGFVRNGAKVYIASRNAQACEQTAQELTSMGPGQCHALAADLSTEEGCRELAQALSQRETQLDVLVNNSGVSWQADLDHHTTKVWDRVLDLNLKSPFFLTREMLPLLDKACTSEDGARVIMIGSVAGITLTALATYSYDASKAALHQLTRKLAALLAQRPNGGKITVNAIALGLVPTRMTRNIKNMVGGELDEPLGRTGNARDVAGTALFLASPAGSWITGVVLTCDGGRTFAKL